MMAATKLVAIPEDELRMYERTLAEVRANTRRTLARCAAAREQRENAWWRQLGRVIHSLPMAAQAIIGTICGAMGAMLVFNILLEVLFG